MNILYLPLEFSRWYSAKKMPYPISLGMVEGFSSHGIDFTVVPALYESDLFLKYLDQIVMGQKFDQLWLEVVHSQFSPELLNFIGSLADVRVGFVIESLTIHPDEYTNNKVGTQRRINNLENKTPLLTHAIVTDERDLSHFKIPAKFEVASVPERMVKPIELEDDLRYVFYGTVYGEREQWVQKMGDRLIINPQGNQEEETGLPQKHTMLFQDAANNLSGKQHVPVGYYGSFYKEWYNTRSSLYNNWINIVHNFPGCGVINLPHRTEVLSARVIESMAAGKVVLSKRMNNGADFLFRNNHDIFLYDDLYDLELYMREITQNDAIEIATNAMETVLQFFTTEKLVQRILKFVEENR